LQESDLVFTGSEWRNKTIGIPESEATTRKSRTDEKLKSPLLNWTIILNDKVSDYAALTAHAVEEFPTKTGPADYALFVEGRLLCIPPMGS